MNIVTRTKNKKLGPGMFILDRPMGTTCPSTCPLWDKGCYAQSMANRMPSTQVGAMKNLEPQFQNVPNPMRPLRLHVGGDFYRYDRLDRKYLSQLVLLIRARGRQNGRTYTYTHCWRDPVLTRILMRLKRFGLTVFASCHSPEEMREASALGYRVAFVSKDAKEGMTALRLSGLKGIVCPEQLGTGLTCDRCGYCWNGKSRNSLVLLKH